MSNATSSNLLLALFVALLLFRYLRTVVGIFTFLAHKPKPIQTKPRFRADDVTVIIPTTFKAPGELLQCLRSIVACWPAEIFIVTANSNIELVKTCCALNFFYHIRVLGVEKLNKRAQVVTALKQVATQVVVCVDDDVFWPPQYLDYLLAIFEDPKVGAGGTRQRVRRTTNPTFWNFLGISYLERRVWNNLTTNVVDGSLSTLSGRTAAYLTEILKTEEFFYYFQNDTWLGKPLNTDDDKCVTRYLYSHGWEIALQSDPRSVIETTVEDNQKGYLQQCLRWARARWRGNFTVMMTEKYWYSLKYCWGCYVIFASQVQTPAILVDSGLFYLLTAIMAEYPTHSTAAYVSFACWIIFTKTVKLIPHFCQHPQDIMFLPVSITFSYLHGAINLYALCTLTTTVWGSQKLEALENVRAMDDEVVPMLRSAVQQGDMYHEPMPGRFMAGDDYFSARPTVRMVMVSA